MCMVCCKDLIENMMKLLNVIEMHLNGIRYE